MTIWTHYINYGNEPRWSTIMKMWPWVDEENARRISDGCELTRSPNPIGEPVKRLCERAYQMARYANIEAKKLRT